MCVGSFVYVYVCVFFFFRLYFICLYACFGVVVFFFARLVYEPCKNKLHEVGLKFDKSQISLLWAY